MLQRETTYGDPIVAGDRRLVPVARTWRVTVPRLGVGVVWRRPVAVLVESPDVGARRLPVRDVTRWVQVALLAAAVAGVLVLSARRRRYGRR